MRNQPREYEIAQLEPVQEPLYVAAIDMGRDYSQLSENLVHWSHDFANPIWGQVGTPIITPNTHIAPDGTLTADTIEDDNAVDSTERIFQSAFGTYDPQKRYYTFISVRKDATARTTRFCALRLVHTGGTIHQSDVFLETSTGEFYLFSSGILFSPDYGVIDDGDYWRVYLGGSGDGTNTGVQAVFFPARGANADWTLGGTATAIGSCVIADCGIAKDNGVSPPGYVKTDGGIVQDQPVYNPDFFYLSENLIIRSQEIDDPAWIKANGLTVTTNTRIAPDGTLTADTLTDTAGALFGLAQQTYSIGFDPSKTYRVVVSVAKDDTPPTTRFPGFFLIFQGSTQEQNEVSFNTQSGELVVVKIQSNNFSAEVENYDEDWWRVSIVASSADQLNSNILFQAYPAIGQGTDLTVQLSTAQGSIDAGGIQLRLESSGTDYVKTEATIVSEYVQKDDVIYLTSDSRALLPSDQIIPGNRIDGVISPRGISGQTQRINPDIAQHTIGNVRFNFLDVNQKISALISDYFNNGAGLRDKVIRLYQGFAELTDCVFQTKSATDSRRKLPPIPAEACH